MSTSALPHSLTYAPPPPQQRLRRWVRRIVVGIFVASCATLLLLWIRRIFIHYPQWREERRLASFEFPSNTVVWTASNREAQPFAFAHVRRVPGRSERVVLVNVLTSMSSASYIIGRSEPYPSIIDLFTPSNASATSSDLKIEQNRVYIDVSDAKPFDLLRAGQADPIDESHFTIDYESKGQRGTIDGWLMPDDSVKLEPRTGPLEN